MFGVIISANCEWQAVLPSFPQAKLQNSPYGEWFEINLEVAGTMHRVLFFHGGWGKISAAGSAQYLIDRWKPELLLNLGTCGGFEGWIDRGTILLVERTLVYDIYEQMGDPVAHLKHYATEIDLSWLSEPYPSPVRRSLLVSGDRDLMPQDILQLQKEYGAVAGDWESGAIAFVARCNQMPLLILRGVSDLVGPSGGEAYQDGGELFLRHAEKIMRHLVEVLPAWLERWVIRKPNGQPARLPG